MLHSLPIAPRFYVTAPQICPYLEGRQERKLVTSLHGAHAAKLNNMLSKMAFATVLAAREKQDPAL